MMLAILTPFKARLVGWGGYWYIEDQELKLTETNISYVEFDADGSYVGTGSYSHLLDFKGATESDRFRWVDSPNISTTEVYKGVELELDVQLIESLTPDLKFKYFSAPSGELRMEGWSILRGNASIIQIQDEKGKKIQNTAFNPFNPYRPDPDKKVELFVAINDKDQSNTRLVRTAPIEHGAGDGFKIKIEGLFRSIFISSGTVNFEDFSTSLKTEAYSQYTPHTPLKWSLKVGSLYFDQPNNTWQSSETINVFYLQNENVDIEYYLDLPSVAKVEDNYTLKLYMPHSIVTAMCY